MLFPGQSVKIQSLIGIMVHQRDILQRLLDAYDDSPSAMSESFAWKSQLKYRLDEETRRITVDVCIIASFHFVVMSS